MKKKVIKQRFFFIIIIISISILLILFGIFIFNNIYNTQTLVSDDKALLSNLNLWKLWPFSYFVTPSTDGTIDYYVSESGTDSNSGTSQSTPFKTIQKAIDLAQPGSTIYLASGNYLQDFVTKRNGLNGSTITITGPKNAIIRGGGNARIIEINHDYIILDGFSVDGLFRDPNSISGYRDKLIYVQGKDIKDGVKGLKIVNMSIRNGGGECIRMRYFCQNNEIAYNIIDTCGVHDFRFNAGGKNGEGIYIGTAPEQLVDGKNPTTDPDESNNNWIHDNNITTNGNECVDIKESSTKNLVEKNNCTGQKDPNSAGLDSRGSGNIFRYNYVYDSIGAGVRLGGDNILIDGINNEVYENKLINNKNGGIKFQAKPQTKICGNTMSGNTLGNSVGTYGSLFNPTQPCAGCTPKSCIELGKQCNSWDNGCGLNIDCGTCPIGKVCNSSGLCVIIPICGNGIKESAEECDDGNLINGDGCSSTCKIESNETKLPIISVTASSNDGNIPQNTIDNNLSTRWSAQGDGQWIIYDLGNEKNVSYLKIAFYGGNQRIQYFDIDLSSDKNSWTSVYKGNSSGKTLELEKFDFPDKNSRYIRIVGHKNSYNDWNSLTEVEIYGSGQCTPKCSGKQCGDNGCGGSCGTCPTGQSCNSTGQCISACTNECSFGQKRCNANYSQTCGNYDADSCLEWSNNYMCNDNSLCTTDSCSNGECIFTFKTCLSGQTCNPANGICEASNPLSIISKYDSYVDASNPAKNYGSLSQLQVKNQTNERKSYFTFDLNSVNSLNNAKLKVYAYFSRTGNQPLALSPVSNTAWTETSITWNNKPSYGNIISIININKTAMYYIFDITNYAKSEFSSGRKILSFEIHSTKSSDGVIYINSKESAINKPTIVLS